MGAELISAAKKCEAMTSEVHNAIAYMREMAAAYREEAKKIFKRIEDCALLTEHVARRARLSNVELKQAVRLKMMRMENSFRALLLAG